jgi:hypothetical protein
LTSFGLGGITMAREEIKQRMDEPAQEYYETHDPEILE